MEDIESLEEKIEDRKRLRKLASSLARSEANEEVRKAGIILIVILAAVVLVIACFFAWSAVRRKDDFVPMAPAPPVMQVSEMVKLSDRVIKRFYAATTMEERLECVVAPDTTRAQMEDREARVPREEREVVGIIEPMDHEAGGRQFLMTTIVFEEGPDRFCVLEQVDGEMKIDWEVLVNYSSMEWDEFIEAQPTAPVQFRVRINSASYYNYDFSDQSRFVAFKLQHPAHEHELFGYLEQSSESFDRFVRVRLMSNLRDLPVIVKLRYPEKVQDPNQVEITEIVSFSWVRGIDM